MKIIQSIQTIRAALEPLRATQKKVALVTTMGNLHDGHLALVQQAKQAADYVVVSIFVNPLQFAPHEDFNTYPRTPEQDIAKLQSCDVDILFLPDADAIYPQGKMPISRVIVPGLSDELCGKTRPHFFYGVTTVVAKLFNIVQPDLAIYGEKDFQQLIIIRQMVNDLNFPITILSGATVREADGLAMSSRNRYLNAEERASAPQLYATLSWIKEQIMAGQRDYENLCQLAGRKLEAYGFRIDYIEVRASLSLQLPNDQDKSLVVLAAAWLGKTRLIDNITCYPSALI